MKIMWTGMSREYHLIVMCSHVPWNKIWFCLLFSLVHQETAVYALQYVILYRVFILNFNFNFKLDCQNMIFFVGDIFCQSRDNEGYWLWLWLTDLWSFFFFKELRIFWIFLKSSWKASTWSCVRYQLLHQSECITIWLVLDVTIFGHLKNSMASV